MIKKSLRLFATVLALSTAVVAAAGCGKQSESTISVTEDELAAIADPEEGRGDIVEDEEEGSPLEAQVLDYTGYDTNGQISFTIYNNTPYEIYSAKVGSSTSSADTDIDILPSTLQPDSTYDFQATLDESVWTVTDWTIYFTDTDGDTSASYDTFNAWNLAYINVTWDSDNNGYVCDFIYYDDLSGTPETSDSDNPMVKGNAVVTTDEIVSWNMWFTVYNETPYEILTITMGPATGSIDNDVDILGDKTLGMNQKLDFEATLSPESRDITEWTLYITDVDGDTSKIYDVFDPWEVSYVDIKWDSNNGGYYCEFVY